MYSVPSLQTLCSQTIAWSLSVIVKRSCKGELSALAPPLRREILKKVSNKRLLYGQAFRSLVQDTGITHLDVSHATNLTLDDLSAVAPHLASCSKINLSFCEQLGDDALTALLEGDLPSLTSLDLSSMEVRGEGLVKHASSIPTLQHLVAQSTKLLRVDALQAVGRHCPRLLTLDLSHCARLGDAALEAAAGGQLETLVLRNCRRISLEGLNPVMLSCRTLQTLVVRNCTFPPCQFMRALATSGLCLHTLDMGGLGECDRLYEETDEALKTLCDTDCAEGLVELQMSGFQITDAVTEDIYLRCTSLETLGVDGCNDLTANAVLELARNCSKLTSLGFSRIAGISNSTKFLIIGALESKHDRLKLAGKG